jgi:hypothetical protein
MAAQFPDSATLYQIFFLAHLGHSKRFISEELAVSRNCVRWHLEGRYLHNYPQRFLSRILPLTKPRLDRVPRTPTCRLESHWLTLQDASYFFPSRPTDRQLRRSKQFRELRTKIVAGRIATTREEIMRFLSSSELPSGLLLSQDACRLLRSPITQPFAACWDLPLSLPAATLRFAVAVQNWTGLPFSALASSDLLP